MTAGRVMARAVALCVVIAACAGADSAAPTAAGSLAWTPCGDGLSCATLSVPVDHADPDGGSIELALAVRPASDPDERRGILLTNPGGPGASGIDTLRAGLPLADEALDHFDVISWDPRGAGESDPVTCGAPLDEFLTLDPRSESPDRTDLDRLAAAIPAACGAGDGHLADHIATIDHVGDMEAIRAATGERSLAFLGFSHGTRLGLEYLARFPDRVDTMVLDSVIDPDRDLADLLADQADGFEALVTDAGGGATAIDEVRDRAELGQLAAEGELVPPVRVDRAAVLSGYDPALGDQFDDALDEALDGDARSLDRQGLRYERVVDFPAYLATTCADTSLRGRPQWDALEVMAERRAPTLGAFVVNEVRPCGYWPIDRAAPPLSDLSDVDGDAAVLLLANTGDPATPVAWARAAQRALPSASLVEIDQDGHIVLDGSSCAVELASRFLIEGQDPDGDDCDSRS